MNRFLPLLLASVALSAHAQQESPAMFTDNYARTPGELAAIPATGGAGGSGSSKVQVVTLLGNPSMPGPYSQLLRVAPGASIAAHLTASLSVIRPFSRQDVQLSPASGAGAGRPLGR